jgi:hypothetical protein
MASPLAVLGTYLAVVSPSLANNPWMTERAVRTELIGKSFTVEYHYGERWTLSYSADGRFDQIDRRLRVSGRWYFRGVVFCSTPETPTFRTGCWTVVKSSANCYEYFRVPTRGSEPVAEVSPDSWWYVRSWRNGEPSTCDEKPSV